MEDLENVILLKKDWNFLCDLIVNAYRGNTDISEIFKQMHKTIPIENLIAVPYFAPKSWKDNEDLDAETIVNLTAKVSQATSFLEGLKNTTDDVTIGVLRSFIDANYENITK